MAVRSAIPFLIAVLATFGTHVEAQCEQDNVDLGDRGGFSDHRLAQDGNRFVVSSRGTVRVFERFGRSVYLEQEFALKGFVPGGSTVLDIDLEGDVLALGLRFSSPTPDEVRLYERNGDAWIRAARLFAPDDVFVPGGIGFGRAVALAGRRLFVGAPKDVNGALSFSGSVYVYERLGDAWTPIDRLVADAVRLNEHFGQALAADGDRLAVGAPLAFSNQQSVYVLEWTGSTWKQTRLTPASPLTGQLGVALDLRADTLLVGDPSSVQVSRAWVYEHDASGWSESAVLVQEGTSREFAFARSVSLSDDGRRAFLGSPAFTEAFPQQGAVHLFEKTADGWRRGQTLHPVRATLFQNFGQQVTCVGDLLIVTDASSATTFDPSGGLCRSLFANPVHVSLSLGGRQTLRLNPGHEHAGRVFLLMGSASGTDPGFQIGRQRVPLVPDRYFATSLPGQGRPPFVNNFGVLRAQPPQAEVTLDVTPGSDLSLVGLTLHHAFVVLDHGIVHVSNARTLRLVP